MINMIDKEDKLYNIYMELVGKLSNQELNKLGYDLIEYVRNDEIEPRICNECGKEMWEGYCIDNGLEYYCSEECLHKNISEEEFEELYDNGNGDSYWTEWYEEQEEYNKLKESEK